VTTTIARVVSFSTIERWDAQSATTRASFLWPSKALGDLSEIRLGSQVPRRGAAVVGVSRPYLRAFNVRRGSVDLGDVREMYLSPASAEALTLRRGDLLFVEGSGSVSEVGRAALWDGEIPDAVHQNSVIRARLQTEDLAPAFVVTWFNSKAGNEFIRQQATTTSGLYHIGANKLAQIPVPIPGLQLQLEIVSRYRRTLAEADDIALAAARSEEQAGRSFEDALVRRAERSGRSLTSVVNFADLDRWDTAAKPTALDSDLPVARLGDVAEITLGTQVPRKGSAASGEETAYLRAANVQRGYIDSTDLRRMKVTELMRSRLALEPGDLVFVEGNSREEVGRSARWPGSDVTTIIQNSIIRVRITSSDVDGDFVSEWFNSLAGSQYMREHATSTSGSLWHLGAGKLATSPLPLPTLGTQRKLVEQLRRERAEAERLRRQSQLMRARAEDEIASALLRPS
jgi:type I restriction enzyme S subunit